MSWFSLLQRGILLKRFVTKKKRRKERVNNGNLRRDWKKTPRNILGGAPHKRVQKGGHKKKKTKREKKRYTMNRVVARGRNQRHSHFAYQRLTTHVTEGCTSQKSSAGKKNSGVGMMAWEWDAGEKGNCRGSRGLSRCHCLENDLEKLRVLISQSLNKKDDFGRGGGGTQKPNAWILWDAQEKRS